MEQTSTNTNIARLKQAGIIPDEAQFTGSHLEILESLTPEEVTQLIALRDRLGVDFVQTYSKVSASFLF